MKYYLRKSGVTDAEGPFTLEEINAAIASGTLTMPCSATSGIGETFEQIKRAPEHDWVCLAEVPGVAGLPMPDKTRNRKNGPTDVQLFFILLLTGILVLVFWFLAWCFSVLRELH